MTTITVVYGGQQTGKRLVGEAIADYINRRGQLAWCVTAESRQTPVDNVEKPDDIILVATRRNDSWMTPWLIKYGKPLFHINVTRNELPPTKRSGAAVSTTT